MLFLFCCYLISKVTLESQFITLEAHETKITSRVFSSRVFFSETTIPYLPGFSKEANKQITPLLDLCESQQ